MKIDPEQLLIWGFGNHEPIDMYRRGGIYTTGGVPGNGLKKAEAVPQDWDCVHAVPAAAPSAGESPYHLYYYSFMRPSFREFAFPEGEAWQAEVLDTWNMTVDQRGIFRGRFRIELGGKPYMAVRLRKA